MENKPIYLKQNALAEPLVNQWYAWTNLISPATAAMYIANWHLRIMQSFVTAPHTHIAALKDSRMLGGPFINYKEDRVGEIHELLKKTKKEQSHLIEFAASIKSLDSLLAKEADGHSLQPFYSKIPSNLKGFVELVYDLNNNPSIRFIEGLLYKSRYYNSASQSLMLSLVEDDHRPFVFTTPRFIEKGRLQLHLPFHDQRIDQLFRMKQTPGFYGEIKEALEVEEKDEALFTSFFTDRLENRPARYNGDGVRIRYMGHACLLIESATVSILTDPVVSYECKAGISRYTYADLPDVIDYALITHNHQDHCMLETLLQLRHKIKTIIVPRSESGALADPSMVRLFRRLGFDQVRGIDEMETIEMDAGEILGIPFIGEHADLNIGAKISYLITLKNKKIFCIADSNNLDTELYRHLEDELKNLDALFLGMECDGAPMSWLYGPLLTTPLPRKMDQSRRFDGSDYERAIYMIDRISPKQVYVYAMGQEPWLKYLTSIQYASDSRPILESDKLINECRVRGLASERLYGQGEIFLPPDPG